MLQKLHRSEIETGGFNGIKQKRLIVHRQYGPGMGVRQGTWTGIGNLVYLADSWFGPGVATGLHPHRGIDVLTYVAEGTLGHEGSLEQGTTLHAGDFQVQRAGKEGFVHNEVNTTSGTTRMLQFWMLPEKVEPKANFYVRKVLSNSSVEIYGEEQGSRTQVYLVSLSEGSSWQVPLDSWIYLVSGRVNFNSVLLEEGTLFEISASKFIHADMLSTLVIMTVA